MGAITRVGRCSRSMSHAVVADLPVPVAPSSTTSRSPAVIRRSSSSMAAGWSPAGAYWTDDLEAAACAHEAIYGVGGGRYSECASTGCSVAKAIFTRVEPDTDRFCSRASHERSVPLENSVSEISSGNERSPKRMLSPSTLRSTRRSTSPPAPTPIPRASCGLWTSTPSAVGPVHGPPDTWPRAVPLPGVLAAAVVGPAGDGVPLQPRPRARPGLLPRRRPVSRLDPMPGTPRTTTSTWSSGPASASNWPTSTSC